MVWEEETRLAGKPTRRQSRREKMRCFKVPLKSYLHFLFISSAEAAPLLSLFSLNKDPSCVVDSGGQSGGRSAHPGLQELSDCLRAAGNEGRWQEVEGKRRLWEVDCSVSVNVRVAGCWGSRKSSFISGKSPVLQPHKSLLPARTAATSPPPPPLRSLLTSLLCDAFSDSPCFGLLTPALHLSSDLSGFFP